MTRAIVAGYIKLLEGEYAYNQELTQSLEDAQSYEIDMLSYYDAGDVRVRTIKHQQGELLEDIKSSQRLIDHLEDKVNQYAPF